MSKAKIALLFATLAVVLAGSAAYFYFFYFLPEQQEQENKNEVNEEPVFADTEAPVIAGAQDLTITLGDTVSYRKGVFVTDNIDERVELIIDNSMVNLEEAGTYPVVYSAVDTAGNKTEVTVQLTIEPKEETVDDPVEDPKPTGDPFASLEVTQEMLDGVCDKILAQITTDSMTLKDKAYAIYKYLLTGIKYVGGYPMYDWQKSAYVTFERKTGDCFFYYACSRALLTRVGIPNIPMVRVGGRTPHYWNAVQIDGIWYHFDACPMPTGFVISGFLIDEVTARAQTVRLAEAKVRTNYYTYDYVNCPARITGWENYAQDYMSPEEYEIYLKGLNPSEEVGEETGLPEDPGTEEETDPAEETVPSENPPEGPTENPSDAESVEGSQESSTSENSDPAQEEPVEQPDAGEPSEVT